MFGSRSSVAMTLVERLRLSELSGTVEQLRELPAKVEQLSALSVKAEQLSEAEKATRRQASKVEEGQEWDLLTVAEIASWQRVHVKTVYAWVERKGLPCTRAGNRLRFQRSAVSRWLQAQREGV